MNEMVGIILKKPRRRAENIEDGRKADSYPIF